MKAEWRDIISGVLGVEPIMINSSLVTAQNRTRYYWTNIPGVEQPKNKYIFLNDIIDHTTTKEKYIYTALTECRTPEAIIKRREYRAKTGKDYCSRRDKELKPRTDKKSNCITANQTREHLVFMHGLESGRRLNDGKSLSRNYREGSRIYSDIGKSATLTNKSKGGPGGYTGLYNIAKDATVRKLTPLECERLQGLPDDYTTGVSNTQRYRMIGNGFTVPVIEHILSYISL
jgi:DNA (cytosine-5)-methyltransferase 3A